MTRRSEEAHGIANIISRLSFFRMGDSGLYMTGLPANADSRSGVNFSRAMLDAFGNSLGSDGAVEQVELLLDANLPEPGATRANPTTRGIRIRKESDAMRFFKAWERWCVRKTNGLRPSFYFIREKRDASPLSVFVAGSCIDLVFGMSAFVDGWSWFFRDTEGARAALSIKNMPTPQVFFLQWKKWTEIVGIVCGSSRFLLVERHGRMGLYTLGAEGDDIRKISACGLVWNRDAQAWTGAKKDIDTGALVDIVQRDSLPSPSVLGYVPEWASLIPRPRGEMVEEERSEVLMNALFG